MNGIFAFDGGHAIGTRLVHLGAIPGIRGRDRARRVAQLVRPAHERLDVLHNVAVDDWHKLHELGVRRLFAVERDGLLEQGGFAWRAHVNMFQIFMIWLWRQIGFGVEL